MKIFDENGNLIENPDLEKGLVTESQRPVTHKYIVTVEEVGHYETITEYPNGGKDVEWVVETPEEGHWETYDKDGNSIETDLIIPDDMPHELEIEDFEPIGIYHAYTEEELAEIERQKQEAEEEAKKAEAEKTALYALLGMETEV